MMWKVRVPTTIPDIEITCYNKDVVDIDFSILKIL